MSDIINIKDFNYDVIVSSLKSAGMQAQSWSQEGLIVLGFSTKLIKITIHEDMNAFRLNVMLKAKLAPSKTISDLYLLLNNLNPQVFFGKVYIHSEGVLGVAYEVPLISGITHNQVLIFTREFDDAVKNVMAYLEQEGFLDTNENNDVFIDISKM